MNTLVKKILNFEKKHRPKKKSDYRWIFEITIIAFIISFLFSSLSEKVLPSVNLAIGVLILLFFIFIGVLFDMIGIAVTASSEKPFHSMSAKKIKAAKTAVWLKKNSARVSSFCNDVVGDIAGIISGTAGIIVAFKVSELLNTSLYFTTLSVTGIVAALTIGGKALGKAIAMNKSELILYDFAKFISFFHTFKK